MSAPHVVDPVSLNEPYWEDLGIVAGQIPQVEQLRGARVLVTGATGMICSAVVDVLLFMNREHSAGITVYVAGRNREEAARRFRSFDESDGLVFVPYDATARAAVDLEKDVDFVIHGASNASPALYAERPVETMLANILGLSTMFELARDRNVRRVLYISSSEVYGQKSDMEPYGEDDYGYLDILNERASYPSSKRAGESLCVAYGMEYAIDSVIVRPGHIYGPSIRDADNRASAEFTRVAARGDDVVLRSKGQQLRSYCHSLDCASAILAVLLVGESSNAYNISNPNSICTMSDIAEAIARSGGVNLVYDIPESSSELHNLMTNSSLTSDKLEALGWKPVFGLELGVSRTMAALSARQGAFAL
ncbi:NAD-dependent epimerase/dehydratase family protein [Leucobacter sp. USHLN153]|uniref:NAD-dependent epimerase/dehydratase family protein n=1 Tax=Leucobacter sp. USHLN153 TaxID=3081268 RepID=UPI003015E72D